MIRRFLGTATSAGVDHPRLAALFVLVVTGLLALGIPRLRVDTSAEGFMVDRDPARVVYDRFKAQFGTDSVTLVVLSAPDVFSPDALGVLRRVTDQLEVLPGVVRVESLANARHVDVSEFDIDTKPLLDADIPADAAGLDALRRSAMAQRVVVGNLVSPDSKAAGIVVYTDPERTDADFNAAFVAAVDAVLAAESRPDLRMFQVGRPLLKHEYSRYILRDITRLIPISAVVMLGTLLFLFRSADAVIVPMVSAGVSVVWSAGLMALFQIPLNVVTAVVPSLLITIGFTEDVHIIADFHERMKSGLSRREALRDAITETAAPILVTTITTVVGFASLVFSDVPMLQQFGWASALSLAGNYVATLAVLPPVVLALPARASSAAVERTTGAQWMAQFLEQLGWFNLRHQWKILGAAAVALVLGIASLSRIDVNTDFMAFFPADATIRTRADQAHQVLTGAELFSIVVDTHRPDGVKDPQVLAGLAALQQKIEASGAVDKTISIADYLATINRDMTGGTPADEHVPDSREAAAQYMLLLHARDVAPLVNADASAAVIQVRHNVSGSAPMKALKQRIDGFATGLFPYGTSVDYTGESILTNNAADYMAVNELTSFAFTFLAIAAIHAVLFVSVRIGLLSLIPDLIPIVVIYGLMSFLGVPLNTGTALIATIAIGISVDDTVHHLMTYARELNQFVLPSMAMFSTLRKVGRAVIFASCALAVGFMPMITSSFIPLRQFGIFASLTMLVALATELLITPTLMLTVRLVTVWDMVLLRIDLDRLSASPCFRGFTQWELRKVVTLGMLSSYAKGATVARAGDTGSNLFLLVAGHLTVTVPGGTSSTVTPGGIVGDLSEGVALWTTDIRADDEVELLQMDFDSLERLRKRFPFTASKLFRNLATVMSGQLRDYHARAALPATDRNVQG